jgi:Carboxypeptidase regulatory-like domain
MPQLHQRRPRWLSKERRVAIPSIAALAVALICSAPNSAWSQSASGTISGTVTDPTGAVIPNASVVLENTATGVKSATVSNGTGFFDFAAVAPGTYKLTVAAQGFNSFVETDIVEHQGENHNIPHINLPISSTTEQVQITASDAAVIPLDNGASSTTLNTEMVDSISVQGRDAAELVKFMPGMAMNSGLTQSEFSSQTTATNSGPIGQFAASGTQPYGSMQMTLDGAGLIDIGNMGTQLANINGDQTAEFTYLNAAFGADTPRGPNIIQVVSKSGGQSYHGDVYTYLRNWQFNANDPYLKTAIPGIGRTIAHQVYPGGTFGGPIPSLFGYNHHHDKLFFFAGFEKMYQNPSATLHQLDVPTTNMINGDFSASTLPGAQTSGSSWWPTAQVPCANAANWTSFCPSGGPNQNMFANGQIPSQYWDADGRALLTYLNKIDPPNIDPATHNGFNYQFLDHPPVNRWELRLRGDWDPTANDKVSVIFTKQNEADLNNFGVWWEPAWTAPLASQIQAQTISNLWTANYVKTFNPTTTNEFSFASTYFTFPPKFANPSAMTAATAGYTTYAPFNTLGADAFDQLPNILSWGGGVGNTTGNFAGIYTPAMVKGFGNAFGNIKKIYSFQDNLTKVVGKHSLKAGFFWDDNDQTQTTNDGNWSQGAIEFDQWSTYTTNNPYADMLIGATDGISQYAAAPVHDVAFHEWAFYGQDQWHATSKLTLDYGIRFDHEGQWYPVKGPGFAVFDPSAYDNTASAAPFTGMKWHQIDSSIPQSGFKSQLLSPDVRVGEAFDVHGNGKTVVRGGFGVYRWQASEGDVDGALTPSYNVQNIVTPSTASSYWWQQQGNSGPGGFAQLATFAPSAGSWCALNSTCPNASALKMGDSKTPYTMNWDAMVDQQLPSHMVFELQYIGNRTDNVPLTNNSTSNEASFSNVNKIPLGALYGTDSLTGVNIWQTNCNTTGCAPPNSSYYNGYRPYVNYGVLNVIQRGSYSNYNGMVVALQKQTGPATFILNYTFSKVMGIRDGNTENGGGDGPTINPFSMRANYGPLAYDRTHLFNAAYNINLPKLNNGNAAVREVVNGWQLSGDTQLQSGAPLQPNTNGSMNIQWTNKIDEKGDTNADGATASNAYLLGTNAPILVPYLTCDPRNGGGKYFNTSCFQTPSIMGQNGQAIWPYIKGPAFFVSDLAMFKNFAITEHQNLQFRVSAFNFLNHPLPQFGVGSDVNLQMGCNSSSAAAGCDGGGSNVNSLTTGNPQYKAPGQNRLMELALKYYF